MMMGHASCLKQKNRWRISEGPSVCLKARAEKKDDITEESSLSVHSAGSHRSSTRAVDCLRNGCRNGQLER